MTATTDKARFFLEQSVPELKEYERKGIFTRAEIASISRKRSDFEHKINARGSTAQDYIHYAEFEMNVEALRRKRVKRLDIKSMVHTGQRRIFFVYDRGTRRFPGDVGLWVQSIQFARRQHAYKKLTQIFTNVLRLHPAKAELWIFAAQFAMEDNGDMTEARSYMQRGLRFCKNQKNIWIQYARLEMAYIAKIHARRQVLGLTDGAATDKEDLVDEQADDSTADVLRLPKLTAQDIDPAVEKSSDVDHVALQNLDQTPAMSGAIPLAIFDAAMQNFNHDVAVAHEFFDTFTDFDSTSIVTKLLNHVLDTMRSQMPQSWRTQACGIVMYLHGVAENDPNYVAGLREALAEMAKGPSLASERATFAGWCQKWLEKELKRPDQDQAVQQVLEAQIRVLNPAASPTQPLIQP